MRRFWVLLLILLLVVPVSYAQDTETEDAGSIEVGERVTGEFVVGVRDRYTLEVSEDGTLNIFLDGTNDNDMYLRVYREGEEEPFAENDDRGDGSLNSAVEGLDVTAGDVLIIEAATYADEGEGAYTLRVAPPPAIEDAGEIAIGDTVAGLFPENTRQRYTLEVEETTALRVLLEGVEDLDTYMRLYLDGEDAPAVQSNSIDGESVSAGFEGLVIPGGTLLIIEAGTAADGGSGDYTLTIEKADVDLGGRVEPVEWTDDLTTDAVCAGAEDTQDPVRLQYLVAEDVLEAGVDYGAVFCTSAGNFRINLYEDEAPITVNSFVYLAQNRFFDNITFHRVIEDFVAQGGDPTGTGYGGPGYEFVNETDNDLTYDGIGVVGMANAGPDTNGSQFFITLAPVGRLDGGYTIFGQVQEGMGSVFDIAIPDAEAGVEPTAIYTVIIITMP